MLNESTKKPIIKSAKSKLKKFIQFWFLPVLIFLAVVFLNTQILCIVQVPTGSMMNTIQPGEFTLGLRLHGEKQKASLERGDIAVFETESYMFRSPDDSGKYYIKRIIGLPGDVVEIKDGDTIINGSKFDDEKWIAEKPVNDMEPITVPPESYFVMGDNRNDSFDSRFWSYHFVPQENIICQIMLIGAKLI